MRDGEEVPDDLTPLAALFGLHPIGGIETPGKGEPGGGAVQFEGGLWRMGPGRPAGSSSALPALSSSTALCPDQAATLIPFSSGADTLHLACLQEVGL